MTERDMVLDILSNTKANIYNYTKMITECFDINLRQTFQKMRDNEEKFQYELSKIAEQKGYYLKGLNETSENCQEIKIKLTKCLAQNQGAGPSPILK